MAINFFNVHKESGLDDFMLSVARKNGVIIEPGGAGGRQLCPDKMKARGNSYLNIDKRKPGGEYVLEMDMEDFQGFDELDLKSLVGTDKIGAIIVSHMAEYLSERARTVLLEAMVQLAQEGIPCFLISGNNAPDVVGPIFDELASHAKKGRVSFQQFGVFQKHNLELRPKLREIFRILWEAARGKCEYATRNGFVSHEYKLWKDLALSSDPGIKASERVALVRPRPAKLPLTQNKKHKSTKSI